MLEQLVESTEIRAKSRGGYLLITFLLVTGLAFSGVLWSLFAKDLGMGNDEFALTNLISPLPVSEPDPAPPTPKQPKQTAPSAVNETTRQTNMLRTDESPLVPKDISTVPNQLKARPSAPFTISNRSETDFTPTGNNDARGKGDGGENGIADNKNNTEVIKNTTPPPPPPPPAQKKPPVVEDKKPLPPRSMGVINGKATNLPKPPYPPAARAVGAEGEVSVQVLIDESGSVISAKAVSGHPLLRAASENAARNAKFSPTLLSNQAVKVSGIIVYKFTK